MGIDPGALPWWLEEAWAEYRKKNPHADPAPTATRYLVIFLDLVSKGLVVDDEELQVFFFNF